jgi:hypothetical protein
MQVPQVVSERNRDSNRRCLTVLLLASHILFLWMFLAAESIEQTAARGQVSGHSETDAHLVACRFAARWKHGMAGNSPIYMPGFFAVGIVTWLWSLGRPALKSIPTGLVLMAAALPIATLFAPEGAQLAVRSFESYSGFSCRGPAPGFTLVGMALSLYTLVTWSAGIFCVQLSIARRSIKPIGVPILMNLFLLRLRPWATNDYVTQWISDVLKGLPIAVFSLLAVPLFAFILVIYQRNRQAHIPFPWISKRNSTFQ